MSPRPWRRQVDGYARLLLDRTRDLATRAHAIGDAFREAGSDLLVRSPGFDPSGNRPMSLECAARAAVTKAVAKTRRNQRDSLRQVRRHS